MTVFTSHRLERLIDFLAERLMAEHLPLSERWVLLPSPINKQYLMVELAQRMPGQAFAGIEFLGWREALYRICCDCGHIPNRLEIELRLAKIFLHEVPLDAREALEPIIGWLGTDPSSRLHALVRALGHQIMEALFCGIEIKTPWQRKLFELLLLDGSWSLPADILQRAPFPATIGQIHAFCVDEMPSMGWNFLIAKGIDPAIYLFSPCSMYWEDSVSDSERRYITKRLRSKGISSTSLDAYESYLRDTHPLLANWGRLGRATIKQLEPYSLPIIDDYSGEEDRLSLLQSIQQDILQLRTAQENKYERKAYDASIQIVAAGSSLLREVQILKDNIFRFLSHSKRTVSDILVLAPDIRPYEAIIQFVFGTELPIRIDPVALLPKNPYLQAWQLFFGLSDRSKDTDVLMELFENAAFQTKHQLTPEDLRWFRIWLKEAKIYRGNWADGLRRMVAGLVYLLPPEDPMARIRSIDWGQADRLASLIHLIHQLQDELVALQKQNHTLDEWVGLLSRIASELFEVKENENDLWLKFSRKLSAAAPYFDTDLFPFSIIRNAFEQDCQSATTAYQPHLIEAIHFSSLEDGVIHEASALFLLGMDSERFPHQKLSSTLDWEVINISDTDRDRYLLLQALFAAKELFCVSYCHLSAHDGKTVDLALPIQELIQTIEAYYPEISARLLITAHPALPYNPLYFQKEGPLQSFAMDAFRAASAPNITPNIFWPSEPITECKNEVVCFELADLSLLARHPWKYFLQRRLKVYLKEESLFSELRRNDLILTPYQEQQLLKQALQHPIDEVLSSNASLLPPGAFGEYAKVQIKKKAAEWKGHLEKWKIRPQELFSITFSKECRCQNPVSLNQIQSPPIVLTIPDQKCNVEIIGVIDWVSQKGLLATSELNLFGLLRYWPEWLALQMVFPSATSIYSLKKGNAKTWEEIDAKAALSRWVQYALRAEESLSPLIFPWTDLFLKKGFDAWKAEAQKSWHSEEDVAIRWILERSQPVPYERIWNEWSSFLKQTVSELITEKEDAAV